MKFVYVFLLLLNLYEALKYSLERLVQHRKTMCNALGKPVIKYNATYNYIQRYESIGEAARENNIKRENIRNVLKFYAKSAGGYYWRYDI
jgi:hypothetical protein